MRILRKFLTMSRMHRAKPVRNQDFSGLTNQFAARIAKQSLHARVCFGDEAAGIADEDCIRRKIEKHPGILFVTANEFFVALALRCVVNELREAKNMSTIVTNSSYHDVGPEPRAVLADPPAAIFRAPRIRGTPQQHRRFTRRFIFVGVKARMMLPDDLIGGVTLDSLRARIPCFNMPA